MSTVYVVHWLAKEVNGHFVSSMIEYASGDRAKAEAFYTEHTLREQMVDIEGHMCDVRRIIVPIVLDQEYKA